MCGIAGFLNVHESPQQSEDRIRRMLAGIRHRGPDQAGFYLGEGVALGNVRLSILDLHSGEQPIANEDGSVWVVYNGETYNHSLLRAHLEQRGHRFATQTDTEVIVHLYEDYGPGFLDLLNGQFAFALWDSCERLLMLARDRMGIRPLFYHQADGRLVFGSEIKALLASGLVRAEIDPVALDQVFTFWSTLSPRTVFKDIVDVPPGHYLLAHEGRVHEPAAYWQVAFPDAAHLPQSVSTQQAAAYEDELAALLVDATRLRLRADVPVGAYLSGGLDSSTTTAIIKGYSDTHLDTFSIAFDDASFDEAAYQQTMARHLGTEHRVIRVSHADVGRVFPDVIWHAEMPILRTSPAPMFLLSGLVHDAHYKVVLTGEGADEILGGYNIFKEDKIRRFWARQPDSVLRPLLLKRLYPYIRDLGATGEANLIAFFRHGLLETGTSGYSHLIRWRNTARSKRFFAGDLNAAIAQHYGYDPAHRTQDDVAYSPAFATWRPLNQAQYLEMTIFLGQYLLSAQGDRMAMAHAVEGRYPFLDYRVVEFSNRLPPCVKLRGLTEKLLLRKVARRWLPAEIARRPKQAYRAPIHASFFGPARPFYLDELLSTERLNDSGLFKPEAVAHLVRKVEMGLHIGETDDMALVGIISSQLLYDQFVRGYRPPAPLAQSDRVVHAQAPVSAVV